MASPLAVTRFGLVDLFEQRIRGEDLGLAVSAMQALAQLLQDDSRRVSEAAAAVLKEVRFTVIPETVTLTSEDGTDVEAELAVSGPPVARAVTVSTDQPWLRSEYDDPTLHLTASPPGPGAHRATVTVQGVGDAVTVPVVVTAGRSGAGTTAPPTAPKAGREPRPSENPEPAPVAVPMAAEATPAPERVGRIPAYRRFALNRWVVSALLLVGAVIMSVANRPGGPGEFEAWRDPLTGWFVPRSSHDTSFIASTVVLLASLATWVPAPRARRLALRVVLGGCVLLFLSGLTFLLLGFAHEDGVAKWQGTTVVAALMAESFSRPSGQAWRRPGPRDGCRSRCSPRVSCSWC